MENIHGRVGLGFHHPYTPKFIGSDISNFSWTTNWEPIYMIMWDLSGDIMSCIGTQIIINTLLKLGMLSKNFRLYTTCNFPNFVGDFFLQIITYYQWGDQ